MLVLYYTIISLAIVVMLVGLVLVFRLRKIAPGGKIGRVVGAMLGFIVLFLMGYLAGPFLPMLGDSIWPLILTAVVFLFGAVFVVLVLRLIHQLIQQVFKELEME